MAKKFQISAGALSVTPSTHPNEMNFRGVLVRLDEASTKPPNGADGHRIYLSSAVAHRRLKTLTGMGLNYDPQLDKHSHRRKVGVIKKAWIEGQDLCVEGVIWKHDFPEAERDLKQKGLGMSMEIGRVQVADLHASVWQLQDFYFLGGTILKKDKAAYFHTHAIAAKADTERSSAMADTKTKTKVAFTPEQVAKMAADAAIAAVAGPVKKLTKSFGVLAEGMNRLDVRVSSMEATSKKDEEDDDQDDEDEEEMASSAIEIDADEDEDEVEAGSEHGIDTGDLEETGSDLDEAEDDDDDPGHLGDGARNKGNKTTSDDKLGRHVDKAVTGAAVKGLKANLMRMQKDLQATMAANKALRKEVKALKAQATKFSEQTDRRSKVVQMNDPMMSNLLAKQGINAADMLAEGRKLTVAEVDGILAASGIQLDPVRRIEAKNKLRNAGLMEDGAIQRGA